MGDDNPLLELDTPEFPGVPLVVTGPRVSDPPFPFIGVSLESEFTEVERLVATFVPSTIESSPSKEVAEVLEEGISFLFFGKFAVKICKLILVISQINFQMILEITFSLFPIATRLLTWTTPVRVLYLWEAVSGLFPVVFDSALEDNSEGTTEEIVSPNWLFLLEIVPESI